MTKSRLAFLDPALLGRLRNGSRRFNAIRARLREHLEPVAKETATRVVSQESPPHSQLTVASYNIHKCVGTDGRFDPGRIAAVIGELDADVVAIQEADERFGLRRGLLDLKALERETGLRLVPISQAADGHGWRGNALFLRKGDVTSVRRLALPGAEPRGALLADLELETGPLRIVAAHLGLLRHSRRWQLRSIMQAIEEGPRVPILLAGDFNEWRPGRRSALHALRPMFGPLPRGLSSFPSYFPVVALDRVIGSPGLVRALEVHDTPLAQTASDHLPLKARIDIQAALAERQSAAA